MSAATVKSIMAKKAKKATKKAAPAKKAAPKKAAAKKVAKKAAKKTAKAPPKKAAKKAAPKAAPKKKAVKKTAKAAPKKAAKAVAKKSAAKKSRAVKSPRAVAAARTPPKSARPPKSSKAAKAAAAAEAEARRPVVVKPRGKGAKAAPLDGVVVLDFTARLPGRIATQMLANFGAEVIKIEPVASEAHVLSAEVAAEDAIFAFLNRGKKSIAVNPKKAAGKDVILQLVKRADVVVESDRTGFMDSRGLGYKHLKNQNKRLIYASVTGYGQSGPMSKNVGYDLNFMALAGLLDLLSGEDGNPLMPGLQLAETAAGALPTVIGILLALTAREKTGVGQQVDVSMYDGLIGMMSAQLAAYSATRRTPQRGKEKLFGQFACYNIYPVRNGRWVSVAALEADYWKALCKAVGREDLIEDQYASGDRQQVLIAELTRIFQKKEVSEWMEFFQGKDVCVTPVRNLGDTLHDEHLIDRQMIVQVRTDGTAYPHVGVFPKLGDTPGSLGGDPPAPGQDSEAILENLGFGKKKIADLLKSKAVQSTE